MRPFREYTPEEQLSLIMTSYPNSEVLILGRKGSGKTAFAVYLSCVIASIFDLQILSNMQIDYYNESLEEEGKDSFILLQDKDQILQHRNFVCVLDELQNIANSRTFAKNEIINQILEEGRKRNIIIHGITQYFRNIDIKLREMFKLCFLCEKHYGIRPDGMDDYYKITIYENRGWEEWEIIEENGYITEIYIPQQEMQKIFPMYDTLEKTQSI